MRTEFLFHDGARCRTRRAVRGLSRASSSGRRTRPVTIRTLDAGGDKPIPGLTVEARAIRSSACAASACRCCSRRCSASSCARWPRRRAWPAQGHAADGDGADGACAQARGAARRGGRGARGRGRRAPPRRRSASWSRCRPPRSPSTGSTPTSFDRLQRPDAVRHGGGARHRRVVGLCRRIRIRRCCSLIARTVARHGSATRARGQPLRRRRRRSARSCRILLTPACARSRSRPPRSARSRRRSPRLAAGERRP